MNQENKSRNNSWSHCLCDGKTAGIIASDVSVFNHIKNIPLCLTAHIAKSRKANCV